MANAEESRRIVLDTLNNRPTPAADIIALNAGAALYAAGKARSIADGLAQARAAIESGAARMKLDQFVGFTQSVNRN